MISDRQRRNLSRYTDMELILYINKYSKYYEILREEKELREKGNRPYDSNGRRTK